MFPTYSTIPSAARDVMTQWYIDRLKEALEGQGDHTSMFLKACQHTEDDVDDNQTRPVGFSGCEMIKRADATYDQHIEDETKGSLDAASERGDLLQQQHYYNQ